MNNSPTNNHLLGFIFLEETPYQPSKRPPRSATILKPTQFYPKVALIFILKVVIKFGAYKKPEFDQNEKYITHL